MTKTPVTRERINIAARYLSGGNTAAAAAAVACRISDIPYAVACALLEKESGGRNVYGHDVGGMLSGFPEPVTRENFMAFRYMVMSKGHTSNGVGPCQITYRGYFPMMEAQALRPWVAVENMQFGFTILRGHWAGNGKSWATAGRLYNGASAYGADLEAKIKVWRERLKAA